MNKKLILTSFVALGFACPAMADTTTAHTSENFPNASQGQYMQEDYTYTGAATETNMAGVYQDNATVYANAHYSNASYTVTAGHYLPADSENPDTPCTDGSFCAGLQSPVNYNENSAQGIEVCPSGYGHSDANASADTQCYRACDINNMGTSFANIAHASAVSGNDYYGNGTDTCVPTDCVNGWHIKPGLNLTTAIGTSAGENSAYVNASGSFSEVNYDGQGAKGQSYYGITANNTWAVDYGSTKGMLTGTGRCSSVQGDNNNYAWTNPTILTTSEMGAEGGQYCYCNVTGYTKNGTLQSVSSPWVFDSGNYDASSCASHCADLCANHMRSDVASYLAFRAAVLGSVGASPASCAANTINISWDGATAASVSANNAGSVEYGSDIRTPESAIHVKGKVFEGWEFSTTAPVNPVTED